MLAVVKKPLTEQALFEVKGEIPPNVISYLEQEFGRDMVEVEDDETYVDILETKWFKEMREQTTPGEIVRMYRENSGLTQVELGRKLGKFTRQKISDIEHNRRSISKEVARKLSLIFGVPVERFLYGI